MKIKPISKTSRAFAKYRLALLPLCISSALSSLVYAGPEGGQVTGGSGSISSTGNTTTIHQQTDRMAIDWQSYNIDVDERVQYIQPDSSSVSLNRILSNSASSIQGRIDANGQVILVNPHGIMFGENSIVNAGGILASGLSIDTDQFMNGDFTFKEIEGTDGAVVASGVINAASGGSVALVRKSVKNEGLISAELGNVHFAAELEAVITFGESGFIGVRVSDALVEEQMGVDAAVLVWHPVHGWAQMTIDGTYPIVSNPIHLNFDAIGYGIIDTYAMVSARPSPKLDEEKQRLKSRKNVHLSLVKA